MMPIKPWEVWFAAVQFEDTPEVKSRPVVVTSTGDIYVCALKVTSHPPRADWGEYALTQWRYAGLWKPSTVRIGKRLNLNQSDLIRKLGCLHPVDIIAIRRIMAQRKNFDPDFTKLTEHESDLVDQAEEEFRSGETLSHDQINWEA